LGKQIENLDIKEKVEVILKYLTDYLKNVKCYVTLGWLGEVIDDNLKDQEFELQRGK
jgi:hypothetical protein